MSYLKEFIRDIESETATPWAEFTPEEKVDALGTGTQELLREMEKTEKAILAAARDPNDMTAQAKFMGNRRRLEDERQQFMDLYLALRVFMRRIEAMDEELTREESYDWQQVSPLEERYHQYLQLWDQLGGECLSFNDWLIEEGLA